MVRHLARGIERPPNVRKSGHIGQARERGIDLKSIAEIAGHTSIRTAACAHFARRHVLDQRMSAGQWRTQ